MMQSENIIDMKDNLTNRYIPSSKKCPKLSFSVDFLVGQDSRLPEVTRTHPECQDKKPLDQKGLSSCSAPDSPPSATPDRLLPTDPERRIRVSESSLTQTRILPAVGSGVFCTRDAPTEQTTVLHPGHHLSTGLLSGLSLHQGIFWPAESVDTGAQGNPFFNQQWWAMAQVKQQQERLLAAAAGMHRFQAGSDFGSLLFSPYRKAKRIRTAFSPSQLLKLEQAFEKNHYVVGNERKQLAQSLNLSETQVKVWFQNRRTKQKRIQQDEEDGGSSRFNGSKEESSTVHQTDSEVSSDIDLEDCEDLVK